MKYKIGMKVKYGDLIGTIHWIEKNSIEVHFDKEIALFDKNGFLIPIKEYINNSKLEIL